MFLANDATSPHGAASQDYDESELSSGMSWTRAHKELKEQTFVCFCKARRAILKWRMTLAKTRYQWLSSSWTQLQVDTNQQRSTNSTRWRTIQLKKKTIVEKIRNQQVVPLQRTETNDGYAPYILQR